MSKQIEKIKSLSLSANKPVLVVARKLSKNNTHVANIPLASV